ncbi:MAG: putative DNA binding domain-containing protein, partial [Chloroflexi bacterium]|nr:putative DNA binding domain-containing protein [Chloroflexota bacterium]
MQSLLETELRKLIKEGESSSVELKLNAPRPTELAERIAGLSNAKGGYIIIGVEDATLRIVGTDPSPTIDTLYRATRFITPMFEFTPHEPEVFNLDGKKVVVATIPPSTGPIYQASGVFWVRRGTNTHPLTMDEVMRLANERGILHWELQSATGTTMSDLDMQKVGLFLKQREAFKQQEYQNRFDTPERILLALKCAVEQNNLVIPTNAGLLFFGYEPQLYLPHTEISCVLLKDELGTGGFLDRRVVTGTLPELIDGCIAFLNRHMTVAGEISGWKRHDYPEHAIGALREAIVNAVVHRDYSRHGERIRLFFYPDRIEIHSPGLLMPGIKVEMMERG